MKPLSGKAKRCRSCRAEFVPSRPMQVACGVPCALVLAKVQEEKQRKSLDQIERKAIRAAKQRIKSRADHMREAQAAVNEYVRLRDRDLPCVSCGRHHDGQYHAGHYRTVGANPELRFDLLNIHKQCAPCNNHKSGDIVNYRIELVRRIGAEMVAWLEGPHEPKKYTIQDLEAIKAKFRAMVRLIKKGMAA